MTRDMLHVKITQCVPRDLHMLAPWLLERACWRQFAVQCGHCKNLELRLSMRLLLILLLLLLLLLLSLFFLLLLLLMLNIMDKLFNHFLSYLWGLEASLTSDILYCFQWPLPWLGSQCHMKADPLGLILLCTFQVTMMKLILWRWCSSGWLSEC